MSLLFKNLSYWEKETYINHTDFLIVGSGIVGLSSAIYLKERFPGQKVTVLESGYLPMGASTKNAGFACIGSPSEILADLKVNDENTVYKTVEKRWLGLSNLKKILGESKIGYESLGSYELFEDKNQAVYENSCDKLSKLNQKFKEITGIENNFEIANNIIEKNKFSGFNRAISSKAEGQIDTGKMMFNLQKLAIEKGILILTNIHCEEIVSQQEVLTQHGKFSFKKLIICTNGFAKKLLPNENVEPARAQVLVTKPIEQLKIKGIYHFDEGYYYFRNIGNRVLLGGGRNLDFKGENTYTIENTECIKNELAKYLKEYILPQTNFEIDYFWAGIMGVGENKSPIVKKVDTNIYCAVRLGGMGVAMGSLVGKEIAELIEL